MAKNKSGSLDTNVLLRLIVGDVPEQTKAIDQLFLTGSTFELADIVIFEVSFALHRFYEFTREDIAESITAIISHPQINCNKILFERTVELYNRQTKLSFVDCALLNYALLNNATPLYTFDKDLAKASPDNTKLLSTHAS